jgi:hypothetical protein
MTRLAAVDKRIADIDKRLAAEFPDCERAHRVTEANGATRGRMIICWPFNGTRTAGTRSTFL